MRLYEIIKEHEFPQAKVRDVKDVPDLYDYEDEDAYWDDEDAPPEKGNPHTGNPKIKTLGTGAFATAYKHKDNPYNVTKGSKASKIPDGFVAFYDALAKDKNAQSNPYFPRFRDMTKYRGQDDRKSYIARMEPLEKYQSLSDKEREALLNKLFSEHGVDLIRNYYGEYGAGDRGEVLSDEEAYQMEILGWAIRMVVENDTWADELRWEIEDQQFKEAVYFLRDTAEEVGYDNDLHYNNLMVRRTSVGPQLVLNDPFGMSTEPEYDEYGGIEGHPDWE